MIQVSIKSAFKCPSYLPSIEAGKKQAHILNLQHKHTPPPPSCKNEKIQRKQLTWLLIGADADRSFSFKEFEGRRLDPVNAIKMAYSMNSLFLTDIIPLVSSTQTFTDVCQALLSVLADDTLFAVPVLRSLSHYLQAQSQGHHTIDRLGGGRGVEIGSTQQFPWKDKTAPPCHINTGTISEGNAGETSERWHGAHMGFSKRTDTTLNLFTDCFWLSCIYSQQHWGQKCDPAFDLWVSDLYFEPAPKKFERVVHPEVTLCG